MKFPVTSMTVMMPDGRTVTIDINSHSKTVGINGLQAGPVIVQIGEAFAIREILDTILD